MSTITNRPQGLVSLTGLRDMGAVPRDLLGSVQCGIDITELLLVDREGLSTVGLTANAVGGVIAFTVPPGELWRIHQFGVRAGALLAAERISVGLMSQAVAGSSATPIGGVASANVTGAVAFVGLGGPFWLGPSGTLAVYVSDIATAGTIAINASATISRFRV